MKNLLIAFALILSQFSTAQMDVTNIVADLPYDLALGNGCGQFGDVGYKECVTDYLELNDNQLDLMWVELTVLSTITNNGIEMDVIDLIVSEQIRLICDPSPDYNFESTIIVLNQTLSIEDLEYEYDIKVFPNPAVDHINIQAKNLQLVQCFDINGRMLFSIRQPVEHNKVYFLNYQQGIYLIKCTFNNGHIETIRFIIQ